MWTKLSLVIGRSRAAIPSTAFVSSTASKILPPDIPIEEECKPGYDPQHFYPVKLGDVLNEAYQVTVKMGHGASSTVWLAKDIRRRLWPSTRYVALKICNNDHADAASASHELRISEHIAKVNPSHPGRKFVRTVTDSFEATGLFGNHLCLVYEPMREPIWLLQRRFPDERYPPNLLRWTLQYILTGLDYLHSECHVIHTDIKLENILVGPESQSVLDDLAKDEIEDPSPRKVLNDRTLYLSRNDFGDIRTGLSPGKPVLADFDTATFGNVSYPLVHPIQPNSYRSPEASLGAPWTYSTDIWNLGLMIWNLLEDKTLCDGFDPENKKYTRPAHLAQFIGLIGPPPKALLDRGKDSSKWFESDGSFKRQDLIPQGITLADTVVSLEGEDKKLFLEFVSRMLQWLLEKRSTAKELLADPWLHRFI